MADGPNQGEGVDDLEGEVRNLLMEAESLTADLAAEIGEAPPAPSTREAEFFESETDSEASLDLQISQAGAALEATSAEVGEASGPAPAPTDAPAAPAKKVTLPPRKPPPDDSIAAVESTGAQDGQRSAGTPVKLPAHRPGAPTPAPAQAKNTAVLRQQAAGGSQRTASREPAAALVAGRVDETPFDLGPPVPGRFALLAQRLGLDKLRVAAGPALDMLCHVLDWADRPFGRVDYRVRRLLGWLALVLTVAALSLLFFVVL